MNAIMSNGMIFLLLGIVIGFIIAWAIYAKTGHYEGDAVQPPQTEWESDDEGETWYVPRH